MKNLFAKLGARIVSAWLFAIWFGWRWLVALPALALLALAGHGAYADHVALAQLRAQLAAPQVAVIDPAALADAAKRGKKLGAPIYTNAGNFIVQSFATSPYSLGSNLSFTDSATPVLQSGTSATNFSLGTNKAGATLNLQADAAVTGATLTAASSHALFTVGGNGSDALVAMGPYNGSATVAALYLLPNGGTAGTNNYAAQNDSPGNLYFNTSNNPGAFYWYNGNFALLASLNQSAFTLSTNVAGLVVSDTAAVSTINGSLAVTTRTVAASFTVDTTTTDYEILADTSGGVITVTLPAPTDGRVIRLVDKTGSWGTHNLTLARHGTETINGTAGSRVLSGSGTAGKWETCTVTSDGTNWMTDCQ